MHRSYPLRPLRLSLTCAAAVAFLCGASWALPASAAPDPADAARLFAEAREICERDHGTLWGRSLCGPMLLVDYTDRAVLANEADTGGKLTRAGALFRGVLPDEVIIANTPTEWSGTRWTQIVGPAPTDTEKRHVLLAHEMFHRVQPTLGLTRPEMGNRHLDTLEGRYLLQLEWRALARALEAKTPEDHRLAVADALAFRHERYRLFADAAKEEGALETNEGIAEYTGVALGLTTDHDRTAYAVYDLSAFVSAPTFVRSFAYATGPAFGLMLDQADPAWRGKLGSGLRFDELLGNALKFRVSADDTLAPRTARYDDGTLRKTEVRRDEERQTRLAAFKARLVDGPVLSLPLKNSNYQFNPQTLIPLEGFGTIYPGMRLTDDWGSLEVERDGALVRDKPPMATVSAVGANPAGTAGDGWQLKLDPGWKVQPGERAGDLVVTRTENSPR